MQGAQVENTAQHAGIYGIMAEFVDVNSLVAAARRVQAEGYVQTDAFSPYPVEGLSEDLGFRTTRVPLLVLIGGILGAIGGYSMQYYLAVHEYPFNVGGRPEHSWPAFIPVTFELTILSAALFAVFGMLALNGLPMPYHPVFNVPRFELASRDRFFLCIEATDPRFDLQATTELLRATGATAVTEVPR